VSVILPFLPFLRLLPLQQLRPNPFLSNSAQKHLHRQLLFENYVLSVSLTVSFSIPLYALPLAFDSAWKLIIAIEILRVLHAFHSLLIDFIARPSSSADCSSPLPITPRNWNQIASPLAPHKLRELQQLNLLSTAFISTTYISSPYLHLHRNHG
jgi:hypothetical protein